MKTLLKKISNFIDEALLKEIKALKEMIRTRDMNLLCIKQEVRTLNITCTKWHDKNNQLKRENEFYAIQVAEKDKQISDINNAK